MSDDDQELAEEATEAAAPAEPATMYDLPLTESAGGQVVLHATPDNYLAAITAMKADGFVSVMDLCGVDYLTHDRKLPAGVTPERFEVSVSLIAHTPPRRVRIRVQVPESAPVIPTLFDLFPGTENLERETYDMFGIEFADHPDPTRILMPADWDGHPLRKDFGIGSVPVQFKGAAAPR